MTVAVVGYYEAWWIQILKAIVIFAVGLQLVPVVLLAERKLLGRFQGRYGPNRVGPYGALQPLADILKLLTKEQFRPTTSVGFLFALAPLISILTAVAAFAIIPFGDVQHIFGTRVGLYGVDVSIGPLYLFAFGAIAFYGIMLGGWSSGSKYSFLGAMRGAAQLISYEVSQGLALVGVIIDRADAVADRDRPRPGRHVVLRAAVLGFLIFLIASFAETNRAPFDLDRGRRRARRRLQHRVRRRALRLLLLRRVPQRARRLGHRHDACSSAAGCCRSASTRPAGSTRSSCCSRCRSITFLFIWVRATLPRLRYDQLMSFGWKVLLPLATLNALVTAILVVATH